MSNSLTDIYSKQVYGKKTINTSGLTSSRGLVTQFERDPITKQLENKLNETFKKILPSEPAKNLNILPEINDDGQENVAKALEELKKLNAI